MSARQLVIIAVLGLGLPALVGCAGRHRRQPRADGKVVVCSTYPLWLMTRNIVSGREGVTVERLLPAQLGCPHDYVATPDDVRRLERADVLVANGLGLDDFALDYFREARPGAPVVVATDGIGDLLNYADAGEEHQGHEHGARAPNRSALNPHLFASPRQAARMALVIGEGLSKADPPGREAYEANARAYAERLKALADEMERLTGLLRNRTIITQHDVFDYLARDVGLTVAAVIAAHPGEDPSAAEVLRFVNEARTRRVGAVFTEPQYPPALGGAIAREAGIPAATLDPVASGPEDAAIDYYEQTMRANMRTLSRVLGTASAGE